MNEYSWGKSPSKFSLLKNEVHVWHIDIDRASSYLDDKTILSSDEIERANHFQFERDRKRFITRRILLRLILGKYLLAKPNQIVFDYNQYGKPSLQQPAWSSIFFNIAHSEQITVFAFSQDDALGIDIERINLAIDYENILEHYFSPGERASIKAQPGQCRPELFYKYWTRKEAYIKGRGMGLSIPLESFDVSLALDRTIFALEYVDNYTVISNWMILDLPWTQGFAGALAVENRNHVIRAWDWAL
jgi:4'-phosphopantetheinyl transferase